MSNIKNSKAKYVYKIGDRVAERPINKTVVTTDRKLIERCSVQRYGTVIGQRIKINKGRRRTNRFVYLEIKWDHTSIPTEHAQNRICPVGELEKFRTDRINALG